MSRARLIAAALLALALGRSAGAAAAEEPSFHPPFQVLDAQGRLVRDSGKPASSALSCVACHDAGFIRGHDLHLERGANVDCLACHTADGLPTDRAAYDAEGRLLSARNPLRAPKDEQCLACHGAGGGPRPFALRHGYLDPVHLGGRHPDQRTRRTGTVYDSGTLKESLLNLEGKAQLDRPWDVHAARLVSCVDCHYSPNKPGRRAANAGTLPTLARDPRQLDTGAYLRRPDHRLASADCLRCHEPGAAHAFLPYAQRHFDRLACQACHVPETHAPVLLQVDRALPGPGGGARETWRNLGGADGQPVNARPVAAFRPLLLSLPGAYGTEKVRPANVITEREWVDAADGRAVPAELVRKAWPAQAEGDAAALAATAAGLRRLGVAQPEARVEARVVPLIHGVQPAGAALWRCVDCHSPGGRMDRGLPLGPLALKGAVALDARGRALPPGHVALSTDVVPTASRAGRMDRLYLPGLGSQTGSTRLGFSFFLFTVLGVLGHAGWRWRTQHLRRHHGDRSTARVYLYSTYERLWHWTMALSTLGLVATGLEVHFNARFSVLGFSGAVKAHNALAVLLLLNGALSLFYHLSTNRIRQFIPQSRDLRGDLLAQARYYLKGIFEGAAHPIPKSPGRKMNPLQQVTYLALLNVLLPFQIVTGILIWGAQRWPTLSAALGGLSVITPLHNLGSWLFLSFTLGHIYLTTTGHTLSSNLKAMVDGWDEVDADQLEHPEDGHE